MIIIIIIIIIISRHQAPGTRHQLQTQLFCLTLLSLFDSVVFLLPFRFVCCKMPPRRRRSRSPPPAPAPCPSAPAPDPAPADGPSTSPSPSTPSDPPSLTRALRIFLRRRRRRRRHVVVRYLAIKVPLPLGLRSPSHAPQILLLCSRPPLWPYSSSSRLIPPSPRPLSRSCSPCPFDPPSSPPPSGRPPWHC